MQRIVLHVDLDYFYAQVEELRKPEIKGKPVAVCMFSGRSEYSGAVATSNYKARELGIKSGMPIALAKAKSKDLVLIPADREHYSEVSERIMDLLREFSENFEQVSIDEAYLECTEKCEGSFSEARKLAKELKEKVLKEEKLTCSVGIGPNKLIAKMASGMQKPNGLTAVSQNEVKEFLRGKRISDLHGVGGKTVEALAENGIKTIPQLAEEPIMKLKELFGEKKGELLHNKALGIDDSAVEEREKQQYSRIVTLKEDAESAEKVISECGVLAEQLGGKTKERKVSFRTVAIIMISKKLDTLTRSRTSEIPMHSAKEISEVAAELVNEFFSENSDFVCRRFGIRISNFVESKSQKSIFEF